MSKTPASTASSFPKFFKELTREPWLLAFSFILMLTSMFTSIMIPWLVGRLVDQALVPKDWDRVIYFGYVFLGLEVLRFASTTGYSYCFSALGQRAMQNLRMKLLSHLLQLPLSTYDKNPAGTLVGRVSNDIASFGEIFTGGFITVFGSGLVILGTIIWLFIQNTKLALVALALMPVLVAFSIVFSRKQKDNYQKSRERLSLLNAFFSESIQGVKTILLFSRENASKNKFQKLNEDYTEMQVKTIRLVSYYQPIVTWVTGLTMAAVIWMGSSMVRSQEIKIGLLISFFSYVLSLFGPIREISERWNVFLSGMAACDRIFSVMEWPIEDESKEVPPLEVEPYKFRGEIEFKNVWFAYSDENWILKNFSVHIKPGQKVGIVGHTGAGKTSFIGLILRLYEFQKGEILIDGVDIRTLDRKRLRASFGIIQQDVFLFAGTLKDNIELWKEGEIEVVKDLAPSFRKNFERILEGSESIKVGERGATLSFGERQVVAFTRALVKKPSVWILDEATSNIDTKAEQEIESEIDRLSRGRTRLVIAHRLSTIRDAHKIIVLEKGHLVEQGTHDELSVRDGVYEKLLKYEIAHKSELTV